MNMLMMMMQSLSLHFSLFLIFDFFSGESSMVRRDDQMVITIGENVAQCSDFNENEREDFSVYLDMID